VTFRAAIKPFISQTFWISTCGRSTCNPRATRKISRTNQGPSETNEGMDQGSPRESSASSASSAEETNRHTVNWSDFEYSDAEGDDDMTSKHPEEMVSEGDQIIPSPTSGSSPLRSVLLIDVDFIHFMT